MLWLLSLQSFLVRRVTRNDQRLTEWSLLYIYNTFLNILAVPNNAVFCITPTLLVIPIFSIYLSNSFVTLPRAPITTGTTSTILSFHNLPISLFKSRNFSIFSLSFSPTLTSTGAAISMIIHFHSSLSIENMYDLLASITLSHWTLIFYNTFTSSFCSALSGVRSYHFSVWSNLFFLRRSQWTFFATLSCRILYSFWANLSHPLTKCCTLSPFFPQNLQRWLSLVLSIWSFIWFVLMAYSCEAHNNASISIFKSFLDNHCQVLSF